MTSRRNKENKHLIVINQTTNPAFNAWIASLANELDTVSLWSGNPPLHLKSKLKIRQGPTYDRSSALSRLWSWGLFSLTCGIWLLTASRTSNRPFIFVVTNPPFMPILTRLVWRLRKWPYALLEWDIYPHILSPMNLAKSHSLLYRLWERLHRRALQDAGLVITISERMADTLRRMTCCYVQSIQIITNWVDTEWIRPLPRTQNPFAKKHGLDDKLVVMYSGNLGATHAIETVVAVAERLKDNRGILFLIIGEGSKRQLIEATIHSERLANIRLLPRQPVEWLPYSLASADVGIVTLATGYEDLSMPSKTYNLLAAGNALLGISQAPNDLDSTIIQHNCGVNFAPTDVDGIVDWLEELAEDRVKVALYKESARQAAENCYSRHTCETMMTATVMDWIVKHEQIL